MLLSNVPTSMITDIFGMLTGGVEVKGILDMFRAHSFAKAFNSRVPG